jgi:CDP-glucose 4,6-dehydratase
MLIRSATIKRNSSIGRINLLEDRYMGNQYKLNNSFKGKSVLVTGHTGFKGSWLTAWLKLLGANVTGISLDAPTVPSHFIASRLFEDIKDLRIDVRNQLSIENAILEAQPDFVFHLAAQSLVRKSYENPIETWQTNVIGTLHVLEALRKLQKSCSVVIVTSDKCYNNVEWSWGYRETDPLGGADPYSASKGAAEFAINSYVKSFFPSATSKVRIASARAGNVIGGGDWAEDRVIPDCIKSWSTNSPAKLRNPSATRPWQHVLEPLSGYLSLAMELQDNTNLHGEAFNFGPNSQTDRSVLDLVSEMSRHWSQVKWSIEQTKLNEHYEAGLLKLNCDKASRLLNWRSRLNFSDTVRMTAEWYQFYYQNPAIIQSKSAEQISEYVEFAAGQGLQWTQ